MQELCHILVKKNVENFDLRSCYIANRQNWQKITWKQLLKTLSAKSLNWSFSRPALDSAESKACEVSILITVVGIQKKTESLNFREWRWLDYSHPKDADVWMV